MIVLVKSKPKSGFCNLRYFSNGSTVEMSKKRIWRKGENDKIVGAAIWNEQEPRKGQLQCMDRILRTGKFCHT